MAETHELKVAAKLLRDVDVVHRLQSQGLSEEHFADKHLKGIVGVALRYSARHNEPLTFDAFQIQLQGKKVEGGPYLAAFTSLLQTSCTNGEFESSLKELKRKKIIGSVETAISDTIDEITEKTVPAEEIARNFRKRALEVGRESGVNYSAEGSLKDSLEDRLDVITRKQADPNAFAGSLSPWHRFNDATNGVMNSELLIVVAEPGGGKTTWMINMSEFGYSNENKNIVYFSHEMNKRALELRYDTRIANRLFPDCPLTYRKIRDGRMTQDELKLYREVLDFQRSKENQIYIVDDPSLDVLSIQEKIVQLKNEMPVDTVVLDYLGILPGASGGWENVNRIAAEVYTLARETNVPVITAAQKNPDGGIGLSYLIKAHGSILLKLNQSEEMRLVNEIEQEFIKNREGPMPRFSCVADFDRITLEELRETASVEV